MNMKDLGTKNGRSVGLVDRAGRGGRGGLMGTLFVPGALHFRSARYLRHRRAEEIRQAMDGGRREGR